ncbi:MAG: response regulator transcription factor [Pseudomonadota bacterium]
MPVRILLLEDDRDMRAEVRRALEAAGFTVECVESGREAVARAVAGGHDALVLDRMLPDLDGLSVLKAVRAAGVDAPVLLLTAMGAVDDRVAGLRAGADDYLTKPFAMMELQARLEALLRRPAAQEAETTLICGDLTLDLMARTAQRGPRRIELQRMEFKLLEFLMRHAGQVVTRTMLLEGVWALSFDPKTNVIDVHVSRLRKKIDGADEPSLIQTVRGAGYRLAATRSAAPGASGGA